MAIYTKGTETADVALMGGVSAMGVAEDASHPPRVITGGRSPLVAVHFEARSNCGRFDADALFATWGAREWQGKRPRHPWSLVQRALGNRKWLLGMVKRDGVRLVAELDGDGYRLRPARECPPEAVRHFPGLDPAARQAPAGVPAGVTSGDLDLVAAMMALGFAPVSTGAWGTGMDANGPRIMWHLVPRSACGKMEAQWVVEKWGDAEWVAARPDHPLSYVMAAVMNRRYFKARVAGVVPVGEVQYKGRRGFLGMDATPEEEAVFFRELER